MALCNPLKGPIWLCRPSPVVIQRPDNKSDKDILARKGADGVGHLAGSKICDDSEPWPINRHLLLPAAGPYIGPFEGPLI